MAFIGKRVIYIPNEIKVEQQVYSNVKILWIDGKNGMWRYIFPFNFTEKMSCTEQHIKFLPNSLFTLTRFYAKMNFSNFKQINKNLSQTTVLVSRVMSGLTSGFHKNLRLRGVGFKFLLDKNLLTITVGYSHELKHILPIEILAKFSRKSRVGRFQSYSLPYLTGLLSFLRSLSKPDPYKGKGIRYRRDFVIRKEGKKKSFLTTYLKLFLQKIILICLKKIIIN